MNGFEALRTAAERYCNALHDSDGEILEQVFMDEAHIRGVDAEGTLLDWDRDAFVERARRRQAAEGAPDYRIDLIRVRGTMGIVMLEVVVGGRRFADQLDFLETSDGWRIVHKTFALLEGPSL